MKSRLLIFVVILIVLGVVIAARGSHPTPENTAYVQENKAVETPLTSEEETQIMAAANQIVKENTEKGYTYTLAIKKHVGNYVRVDVTPGQGEMIDPAQVILQKQEGNWKALMFGTSFPDMYDKVPTLFE